MTDEQTRALLTDIDAEDAALVGPDPVAALWSAVNGDTRERWYGDDATGLETQHRARLNMPAHPNRASRRAAR